MIACEQPYDCGNGDLAMLVNLLHGMMHESVSSQFSCDSDTIAYIASAVYASNLCSSNDIEFIRSLTRDVFVTPLPALAEFIPPVNGNLSFCQVQLQIYLSLNMVGLGNVITKNYSSKYTTS